MKQNQKQFNEDTTSNIETTTEPIEYFIPESFGFKFVFKEAQNPDFAENLVDELNNKEEKQK